jgi:hypothetical protein
MKTFTIIVLIVFALMLATQVTNAQQQIPFQGMVSQGFGVAAWNADGSGPEPAATGHLIPFPGFGNIYYYGASRDYVSGNPNQACFAFLPGITEFPNFTQRLTDHGYLPSQVKVKFGLVTLGDDEEGLDWFVMNDFHHSSHKYSDFNIFELNGEPMLAIKVDYALWSVQSGTTTWIIDFGYTPVVDISGSSSSGVQAVAQAFLEDLDGKSIRLQCESTYGGINITGNGRNGALYNIINGTLTVGNPTLPFKGLYADNEGVAAWNADGTGPEPYGNGHLDFLYYGASVDYDCINPNPDACLGHCLEGSKGFLNTLLQLQYRNFEIGDMKMKMGLSSLGPDVEGEDWGTINGMHWLNQYNNSFIIEINGEPILEVMQDTNTMLFVDPVNLSWTCETSVGKVYNISDNASADAQFVALSFLRDLGSHYLKTEVLELSYAGSFSGNGRSGAYYQIDAGELTGVHENITFIPPGEVSGTWAFEGSPYYVDGHLEIANSETLIIEPGVKVAVRGPYHFNVQGCVKAEGTDDENIIFTRSNPNLYWDGFDYVNTPLSNTTSVFDHCLFEYSRAQGGSEYNSGGAIGIRDYDGIVISNSVFRYNMADLDATGYATAGGALGLWNASPFIQKCVFYDNYALDYAGAILIYMNSSPVISNCLFYENESPRGGAIAYYSNGKGLLINNTIADNYASMYGGALYLYGNSSPQIINNIIWHNEANNAGEQVFNSGANNLAGYFYNNIEGGLLGFGGTVFNGSFLFYLDEDPLFTNDPGSLYMISGSSPCYNAGTPDTSAWYYPQHLPETCLCGNPRICDGRIDMGAFEWLGTGIRKTNEANMALQIHPNPVTDFVYIEFNLPQSSLVSIQIFNAIGVKVAELHHGQLSAGQQQFTWHTGDLPKGLYFCRVQVGEETTTQKVIKY